MSSQTLKFLAVLMVIGSVVLAFVALRISRAPETPPKTANTETIPQKDSAVRVVVAARPIPPGEAIRDADLALAAFETAPPNAFKRPEDIVGKRPVVAIGTGNPVLQRHFLSGNPLIETLREDERAIAVKVNNLIGVGGFPQPGDRVDVLLYLRGDHQQAAESQSLVVVRSVRVLAYGGELSGPEDAGKTEKVKSKEAATAVLAVSAEDAVRLTLAENAGILRLALRPSSIGEDGIEDRASVRLSEIIAPGLEGPAPQKPQGPVVEVYRGGQKSMIQFQ